MDNLPENLDASTAEQIESQSQPEASIPESSKPLEDVDRAKQIEEAFGQEVKEPQSQLQPEIPSKQEELKEIAREQGEQAVQDLATEKVESATPRPTSAAQPEVQPIPRDQKPLETKSPPPQSSNKVEVGLGNQAEVFYLQRQQELEAVRKKG